MKRQRHPSFHPFTFSLLNYPFTFSPFHLSPFQSSFLHHLKRHVFESFLKRDAGRKDHANLNRVGVKLLGFGCSFARNRNADRTKFAHLHAETVEQITRNAVYEIGEHILDVAPRERRTPRDVGRNLVQRFRSEVKHRAIQFLFGSVLRISPLLKVNFHLFVPF